MPLCVIKHCKNNSNFPNTDAGLSFHRFPKDEQMKDKWMEIIRNIRHEPEWYPSTNSVVCSKHFVRADRYGSKNGFNRLHKHAVPKCNVVLMDDINQVEVPIQASQVNVGVIVEFRVSSRIESHSFKTSQVTDPTNLTAIKLHSSIVLARIPISFRVLPRYIHDLWLRMKSIGTRPFATLATEENFKIFLKCSMYICEAKVAYAQMRCNREQLPPFPMPTMERFTKLQLRELTSLSRRLPYPLAIYVEAIGNFNANGQPVVPVLIGTTPDAASGAISYAPTQLAKTLQACRQPLPADNVIATIAHELDELLGIDWVRGEVDLAPPADLPGPHALRRIETISVTAETLAFWNGEIPTIREREVFNQIVSSMDSKKGFNIQCDITTGDGSVVQVIRFPESFDPDELETCYYTNTDVPTFEEQLAPAIQLGYEHYANVFSRFCGSYAECLKHGNASAEEARHAVIWTNSDHVDSL